MDTAKKQEYKKPEVIELNVSLTLAAKGQMFAVEQNKNFGIS